jgi:hypothetical protein
MVVCPETADIRRSITVTHDGIAMLPLRRLAFPAAVDRRVVMQSGSLRYSN